MSSTLVPSIIPLLAAASDLLWNPVREKLVKEHHWIDKKLQCHCSMWQNQVKAEVTK